MLFVRQRSRYVTKSTEKIKKNRYGLTFRKDELNK